MAAPNRAAALKQAQKVLKKHYKPIKPNADRSVLETILYACCLENAHDEKADEAFARLQELFFDWNEVRVTTVTELAEVMSSLPAPQAAATNLKRCLQNLFEAYYSFDLDAMRKENIGKAEKKLIKHGATPYVISYVKQNALGGHAIPVDKGASDVLVIIGAITEAEAAKNQAPGLERAVPKSKGVEFGSLLHQLGADLVASPFGPKARKILLEIAPDAKDRLPKRASKTPEKKPTKKAAAAKKKSASKPATKKTTKKAATKKAATTKKAAAKPTKKKTATKAAKKKAAPKKAAKKKTAKKTTKSAKTSTKRLAKKKPR